MKRKIAIILAACLVASMFSGCCLKHEWENATCENPKTCAKCGKTEGEMLGHEYELTGCVSEGETIYELHICEECGEMDKTIAEDQVKLAETLVLGKWMLYDPEGHLGDTEAWIEFREDGTGGLYANKDVVDGSVEFKWFSYTEKYNMEISGTDEGDTIIMYGMEEKSGTIALIYKPDGECMMYLVSGGVSIPFSR